MHASSVGGIHFVFCFSTFDGTLSLKCQVHSTGGKPEEEKEEMPKGSGAVF